MYVNERGEVNYHSFIKAVREHQKVLTEVACEGVCTVSGWNRFENGNRLAEKLMGDRLVARLGVSGEKYEDYLQPKEYVLWLHRMRIVQAIENKDLPKAKEELDTYEISCVDNCVNNQFILAMRYMILMLEGVSDEVLLDVITSAVRCTVPNVEKALDGAQLLCDQEVNLIAEQIRLIIPPQEVVDASAWRISEYKKLLAYIDVSHWENLQKAKVYPKITYFICRQLMKRELTVEEQRMGLKICHNALEILRDTCRLYYFVELTEARRAFAERLLAMELPLVEYESLEEMLLENNEWENAIRRLYLDYEKNLYMEDFCYLYYETECYNMAEIIEIRRKMVGLSRVKLSEGICTDRTIIRFEREGRNPSIDVMRSLFEKLGLCAEYRRTQIVTTNIEALNFYHKDLVKLVNNHEYEEALAGIERLKDIIDLQLPYNKQEIKRVENYLLYHSKKIGLQEFAQNIIETLECTISISNLLKRKETHLTRAEFICLHDLAFDVQSEVSDDCLKIISRVCENALRENKVGDRVSLYEFSMERLASKLGGDKCYKNSNEMCHSILKECVLHYRMANLSNLIYNLVWNHQQEFGNESNDRIIVDKLQLCATFCRMIKKYNDAAFFQMKIDSKV